MTQKAYKNKITTSIIMEKDEQDELDQIRWREKKSKNDVMRRAIQEFIRNHKDGNSAFTLDQWSEDSNFKAIPTLHSRSEIWYQYLSECTQEELVAIMIKSKHLNDQCQAEGRKRR